MDMCPGNAQIQVSLPVVDEEGSYLKILISARMDSDFKSGTVKPSSPEAPVESEDIES